MMQATCELTTGVERVLPSNEVVFLCLQEKPIPVLEKVVHLKCEIFVVWNIFTALNKHLEEATKALKWQQE